MENNKEVSFLPLLWRSVRGDHRINFLQRDAHEGGVPMEREYVQTDQFTSLLKDIIREFFDDHFGLRKIYNEMGLEYNNQR